MNLSSKRIAAEVNYGKALPLFLPYAYAIMRIIVGLLFVSHGGQKIFGWFGGQPTLAFSLLAIDQHPGNLAMVWWAQSRSAIYDRAVIAGQDPWARANAL
jgi:hypothetical protein